MTCRTCNDTGCEPQFVPSGDWYCVLCSTCDPSQPGPVAPDLLGDICESCGGTGRETLTVTVMHDGGLIPDYIEGECGDCRGWGVIPFESQPPDVLAHAA